MAGVGLAASDGPPYVGFLAQRMWVTAQRAWDLTTVRGRMRRVMTKVHPEAAVSAGVEVRNVAGLSYTTSSAFIFPSRGCSWASNSVLAALLSPSPLVHLKAARLCRSKALGRF